ncbi:MAG TPA: hypothetical protein VI854_10465, partial [Acidimicrobiia bacterium]|nr:hypothetical protein [Acidimicrobiia bacterium]
MRWFRISVICALAALVFLLSPTGGSHGTPGAGGTVTIFSVRRISAVADISAAVGGFPGFITCTSADVLAPPFTTPAGPCPGRAAPVPDGMTNSTNTGLDTAAVGVPFSDDLDGLSLGETLNAFPTADYD